MVRAACMRWGGLELTDLDSQKSFERFSSYGRTKLANAHFLFKLAQLERASGSHVCINSLSPGEIQTDIARDFHWFFYQFQGLLRPLFKTQWAGTHCTLFLAASPEAEGVTGEWFENCEIAPLPRVMHEKGDMDKAWEWTVGIIGVQEREIFAEARKS